MKETVLFLTVCLILFEGVTIWPLYNYYFVEYPWRVCSGDGNNGEGQGECNNKLEGMELVRLYIGNNTFSVCAIAIVLLNISLLYIVVKYFIWAFEIDNEIERLKGENERLKKSIQTQDSRIGKASKSSRPVTSINSMDSGHLNELNEKDRRISALEIENQQLRQTSANRNRGNGSCGVGFWITGSVILVIVSCIGYSFYYGLNIFSSSVA